jgi:hypothetical protein
MLGEVSLPVLGKLVYNKDENFRLTLARALGRLGKIANQELFTMTTINPFEKSGGFAAIVLIQNNLPEYFSEDSLILHKSLKSVTAVRLASHETW